MYLKIPICILIAIPNYQFKYILNVFFSNTDFMTDYDNLVRSPILIELYECRRKNSLGRKNFPRKKEPRDASINVDGMTNVHRDRQYIICELIILSRKKYKMDERTHYRRISVTPSIEWINYIPHTR